MNVVVLSKFSDLWKVLIVFNLLISIFIIWTLYSQNIYIFELVQERNPIVVAANTPQTAVVINPFTGSFILVNSFTLFSVLVVLIVIIILLVFFYKRIK